MSRANIKLGLLYLVLVECLCSSVAQAGTINAIIQNNAAVRDLEKKDKSAAESKLLNAMAEDSFNPILHLNLGLTYEADEKFDKAYREYLATLRSPDLADDLKFKAHFNAGNAAAGLKKTDDALKQYQAALDINPKSEEVKTNIELLLKGGEGKGKGNNSSSKGDNKSDQDKKDQQGNQNNNPEDNNKNEGDKDKKKEFKSPNLSKEDVRKILNEIKSQEQKVRALDYGTKGKEASPEKDW